MAIYENNGNLLRCFKGTRLHYFAHRHREIELVMMLEGRSRVTVEGVSYAVEKGDVLLVFPNQLHQYVSTEMESYFLFLLPIGVYGDYLDSIEGFKPRSPIIKGGMQDRRISFLTGLAMNAQGKYTDQQHKYLAGTILGLLLENLPLENVTSSNKSIERVMHYCEKHYLEQITLDSMAKELYLGKYYISHLFNRQLGISFNSYINALRIEEAVKLLTDTEMSVTEICFSAGFTCLRTFNRAFIRQVGMSPRDYRQRRRAENRRTEDAPPESWKQEDRTVTGAETAEKTCEGFS